MSEFIGEFIMPLAGLLMAATLLNTPTLDVKAEPRAGDYPIGMLQANKSAYGDVDLIISPKGDVESCILISSVGDTKFAGEFCQMFSKFRWHPALDTDGSPIYAELRISRKFFIPGTPQGQEVQKSKPAADFEIRFPEGTSVGGKDLDVYLSVEVGPDGTATACARQSRPGNKTIPQRLVDLACSSVLHRAFGPINTKSGSLQHYVTGQIARFRG
jgi:hypothetical protein